jgi:superfamily II DNA or RNA helicase
MTFQPRKWQQDCLERFEQKLKEGSTSFVLEACMGAGKSAMAAWLAKILLDDHGVDHVLVLVPWVSIQGDVDKGMLGAFGETMGLDARDRFFTHSRRQVRQPRPRMAATITLYHEVCCQEAIETLKMWKAEGFTFALICDEIHHTNEINSTWGVYVEQIERLASYSIFMSGTYFRSDRKPISCIPLDASGDPIKDYRFTYTTGVKENVVRAVTTRDVDAKVVLYDRTRDRKYERMLSEIENRELAEAKKQVLDPHGECIRHMIENVHQAHMQTRSKFPDAACLFVCRPGGGEEVTREGGGEAIEDRNVDKIAKQIEAITGETPTVVTHRDRDAVGKIARFRRGTNPYLVAINMVSEGCDIPRLRAVAFCRYTKSEMLFRQIVGRALRLHEPEDGTAAQIYIPAFPKLVEFAERLYSEAQEGVRDRRCGECGGWPCECACPECGQHPCECAQLLFPTNELKLIGLDATPQLDGGHVGADKVTEHYVRYAITITQESDAHSHYNHTQLGHALQRFVQLQQQSLQQTKPAPRQANPAVERELMRRRINRYVRQLAFQLYDKEFQKAYYHEIEVPFRTKFKVIINTWTVDKLREVADRLERRIMQVFRNG